MNSATERTSIFVEAYATNDSGDSPLYGEVTVTKEVCDRLMELERLCKTHKLSEARSRDSALAWGPGNIEDELRLINEELVVCGDTFWFTAQPKHADYLIETRAIRIRDFVRTLGDESTRFFGDYPDALEELVSQYAPEAES